MTSPERPSKGSEVKTGALEQAAAERAAELTQNKEMSGEHYNDSEAAHSLEKARAEANAEATSSKEQDAGEHIADADPTPVIVPQNREQSYQQTMKHVRQELSAPERAFSKVIHNPVIERVSEVVGGTVARPNAILSGSLTAFILLISAYMLAKHIGFSLQGSETLVFFALGWALGIAFDMLRGLLRR